MALMHVLHHAVFAHTAHAHTALALAAALAHSTHTRSTSRALSLLSPLTHAVLSLHGHLLLLSGGRSSMGWRCGLLGRRTKGSEDQDSGPFHKAKPTHVRLLSECPPALRAVRRKVALIWLKRTP